MEFDPNKALMEIRESAQVLQQLINKGHEFGRAWHSLVTGSLGLDEWMSKGGHPPEAWCPISQSAHSAFHMEGRE